jgi:hypothetical protein
MRVGNREHLQGGRTAGGWLRATLLTLVLIGGVVALPQAVHLIAPEAARAALRVSEHSLRVVPDVSAFPDVWQPSAQSAAHPDIVHTLAFNYSNNYAGGGRGHFGGIGRPVGNDYDDRPKKIQINMPPGVIADPSAVQACPVEDFRIYPYGEHCPMLAHVGEIQSESLVIVEPFTGVPTDWGGAGNTKESVSAGKVYVLEGESNSDGREMRLGLVTESVDSDATATSCTDANQNRVWSLGCEAGPGGDLRSTKRKSLAYVENWASIKTVDGSSQMTVDGLDEPLGPGYPNATRKPYVPQHNPGNAPPLNYHVSATAPYRTVVRLYGLPGPRFPSGDSSTPSGHKRFIRAPVTCGETTARLTLQAIDGDGAVDYQGRQTLVVENHVGLPAVWDTEFGGCENVPFDPSLHIDRTPSGEDLDSGRPGRAQSHRSAISLPADDHVRVDGVRLARSTVRASQITMPQGLRLNPTAARTMQACSSTALGMPGAVNDDVAQTRNPDQTCPVESRLGTATVRSILPEPLPGRIYMRAPLPSGPDAGSAANPFNLAVVAGPTQGGRFLKVPGTLSIDPDTGRLTARVTNVPDLPFSRFDLELGGVGGLTSAAAMSLVNPDECGQTAATARLLPYRDVTRDKSGNVLHEPSLSDWPQVGVPPASGGPGGSISLPSGMPVGSVEGAVRVNCTSADNSFAPVFSVDQSSGPAQAGSDRFPAMEIERPAGDRLIRRMAFTLPAGFSAKLAGRAQCDSVAAAEQGVCPPSAKVGTASVRLAARGVSAADALELPADLVLVKPRPGMEFMRMAIVVDATDVGSAGLNIGRIAISTSVDIEDDLSISIDTGDMPGVIRGIPMMLSQATISMDDGFVINPHTCGPKTISAHIYGDTLKNDGTWANSTQAFHPTRQYQVGGCETLPFNPVVRFQPTGIEQNAHPASYRAMLPGTYSISIGSPSAAGFALRKATIESPTGVALSAPFAAGLQPCTPAQFQSPAGCPAASRLGTATLSADTLPGTSTTGEVSFGPIHRNPDGTDSHYDLFMSIPLPNGPAVRLTGTLRIDPDTQRIVTEFDAPAIPFRSMSIQMQTGSGMLMKRS